MEGLKNYDILTLRLTVVRSASELQTHNGGKKTLLIASIQYYKPKLTALLPVTAEKFSHSGARWIDTDLLSLNFQNLAGDANETRTRIYSVKSC